MTKKLTIATTGLNAHDNPGPGIPVVRCLREAPEFDVRIIGLAYENLEPGMYLPDVDKTYLVPYPAEGKEKLLERLSYIHSVEKLDIIIPNYDAELFNYMKISETLAGMGIKTFLPEHEAFEERQKHNLPEFGEKYNLNVPKSKPISGEAEINQALEKEFGYPLVVKGKYYDAYIAHSPEQAVANFRKIAGKWGLPVIIQKFVKGTEVNVAALGDGTGKTIAAVPMKKLYITDKGKGWAGITLDDDNMLDLTRQIIKSTRWRGGMELELIKDENDKLFIVEINPRIPAWVYLSVGAVQNIPAAMVRMMLGENPEPYPKHKSGVIFIRYSYDILTTISEFQKIAMQGEL